jgi:hypothetical protein
MTFDDNTIWVDGSSYVSTDTNSIFTNIDNGIRINEKSFENGHDALLKALKEAEEIIFNE